jgi:uncharacterized DUF497 family protein
VSVDFGPFEWDPKKNVANRQKHGIDFIDAAAIFSGPSVEGLDERFGNGEPRIIAYGQLGSHVIAVVFCWRKDRRRIISARKATRSETRMYWEIVYGDT